MQCPLVLWPVLFGWSATSMKHAPVSWRLVANSKRLQIIHCVLSHGLTMTLFTKLWSFSFTQPSSCPFAPWPWPKSARRQVTYNGIIHISDFCCIIHYKSKKKKSRSNYFQDFFQTHHWVGGPSFWGKALETSNIRISSMNQITYRWWPRLQPSGQSQQLGSKKPKIVTLVDTSFTKGMLCSLLQPKSVMIHIVLRNHSEEISIWMEKEALGHEYTLSCKNK